MSVINAISRAIATYADAGTRERLVIPTQLQGTIELGANRLLHLRDALGTRIEALTGVIWITQSGDIRDIVVEAGDAFVVDRDGEVVVSAVSDATFRVASALAQSAERAPETRRRAPWLHSSGDAVSA